MKINVFAHPSGVKKTKLPTTDNTKVQLFSAQILIFQCLILFCSVCSVMFY